MASAITQRWNSLGGASGFEYGAWEVHGSTSNLTYGGYYQTIFSTPESRPDHLLVSYQDPAPGAGELKDQRPRSRRWMRAAPAAATPTRSSRGAG